MELFGDGGLKDEGGMVDEVSGNEVPVGGTKEGVRDDIPANVSEGEFIFPADVVRFVGLDKLMSIRQDAKMGLKQMEAMGQMGNSDEATMDDDMPFGMADLVVVGEKGEPMEFADGGFIPTQNFQEGGVPKKLTFKDLMGGSEPELVLFVNAAGEKYMVPFVNGVPMFPIPEGYTRFVPVEGEEVSPEDVETAAIVAAVNPPRREKEYDPMKGVDTTPVNWMDPELSGQEFLDLVKNKNTYGPLRTGVEAVFSFIPIVGILGKMAFRDSDKKILAALNARAKAGEFDTPELQKYALDTATAVEKAGTSIIGKAIDLVGGLLGKTKEESSAAEKLQSIIDSSYGDKSDNSKINKDANGSIVIDPEYLKKLETDVAESGLDELGKEEKIVETLAATSDPNAGLTPNEFGEFGRPTVPSTNIVPSASTDTLDTDLGKFSGSPSASTDFKNLSTKDQIARLENKGAFGSRYDQNTQSITKDLDSNEMQALQNLQMTQGTRASFDDDYRVADQVYGAAGGTKVAGGPAIPFSKTSNSLRNIFAGPDDGTRDAIPSGPATIAKTERISTEPVNTRTGTPGFRDRSISSTTDLQSTQPDTSTVEPYSVGDFFKKIVNTVVDKIPERTMDAAGRPINPRTGESITGKVTKGSENFNTTAAEKIAQKAGEDKQEENRQKRNQARADANAAAVKVKTKENVIEQQRINPVYGRAKGGLINKPKAKKTKTTNKRGLAARK